MTDGTDGTDAHLCRRWVHVREEDHGDVLVYRPADAPLPPARGRDGLEFRPDGTFVDHPIGRGDAPDSHEGSWRKQADGALEVTTAGGGSRVLRPRLVAPDRLELTPGPA